MRALALILIAVVGLLWLAAVTAVDLPGDRPLGAWSKETFPLPWESGGHATLPAALHQLSELLKGLGNPLPAAILTLIAAGVVAVRMGPRFGALLLAAATVGVATSAMKAVAPRPGVSEGIPSFPSGHTAYATAVLGTGACLAARAGHRWAVPAAAVLIVLMGVTRVLSGSHWLSDVLAGWALGGAWLLLIVAYGLPWADRNTKAIARPRSAATRR